MKDSPGRKFRFPPLRFAADVVHVYFSRRVSQAAAGLAYSLILTFFPIIICVSAFLDQLNLNFDAILEQISGILPPDIISIFRDYLGYLSGNRSGGMLAAGIIMTVLFASAALRSLMHVMQDIYGHSNFRGPWQLLASVLFALFLLVTIYLSMVVVVTGNWFFHMLGDLLHLEGLVEYFDTWQWLKYVILLAFVFLFILLLYRFAAPLEKPRPTVFPGALLASVALAAASLIFSLIMGGSTRYSLVYGSLASVIILLLWLYLCGNILILGSVINYVIYSHKKEKQ